MRKQMPLERSPSNQILKLIKKEKRFQQLERSRINLTQVLHQKEPQCLQFTETLNETGQLFNQYLGQTTGAFQHQYMQKLVQNQSSRKFFGTNADFRINVGNTADRISNFGRDSGLKQGRVGNKILHSDVSATFIGFGL